MAKPRPPEETDSFRVRPPESIGQGIRDLAAQSRDERGGSMSANRFIVEILKEAVKCGTTVQMEIRSNFRYARNPEDTPFLNDKAPDDDEKESPDPDPSPGNRLR